MNKEDSQKAEVDFECIVVGAGLSGLYALHRLRSMGLSVCVFEAGEDVGGTWFWNCYPGARCDIESIDYSYSFSPELDQSWRWKSRYAEQGELLAYLRHVADRFDLRGDIRFNTTIAAMVFDEQGGRWILTTQAGETVTARFCIMATGNLSTPRLPDIPGLESYEGEIVHTGKWPREGLELRDRRVGLIGTGASGVQLNGSKNYVLTAG